MIGQRVLRNPKSVDEALDWFDDIAADQSREMETMLAVKNVDVDEIDELLAVHRTALSAARDAFRRALVSGRVAAE